MSEGSASFDAFCVARRNPPWMQGRGRVGDPLLPWATDKFSSLSASLANTALDDVRRRLPVEKMERPAGTPPKWFDAAHVESTDNHDARVIRIYS